MNAWNNARTEYRYWTKCQVCGCNTIGKAADGLSTVACDFCYATEQHVVQPGSPLDREMRAAITPEWPMRELVPELKEPK